MLYGPLQESLIISVISIHRVSALKVQTDPSLLSTWLFDQLQTYQKKFGNEKERRKHSGIVFGFWFLFFSVERVYTQRLQLSEEKEDEKIVNIIHPVSPNS